MIYDSVIQNDITYVNHFNWWGIIKQDSNAQPPDPYDLLSGDEQPAKQTKEQVEQKTKENQELEQEKKLRENEGKFYRDYLDSGNSNMSLLDAKQQKEFTDAENSITDKNPNMPESKKLRKLIFDQVQSGRKQQLQQQPQQPKRGLTRRALGAGVKAGKGILGFGLGAAKRNIQDAVTMPIEGAKKLGRGIADSVSRTEQGLQERTDYDTKRRVQQIDAKTPEVKSKEAQQIKELASSRVFGRKLAEPMQGDVLNRLITEVKNNPDTFSGGRAKRESLDDVAGAFGMDGKDKTTIKRIFGNELSPIAIKALEILYKNKQGTPSRRTRRVTPASERKQPKRRTPSSTPVPIVAGN